MNNTTTFRHPHSPKSTTPTAASATIMDRAVSSRRSAAPYSSDAEPLTCASPIRVAEAAAVDESKTKRQHLSLLASNYLSRIANSPCLVLCIVTALVVISLAFHSRSLVCVSPYDPVSRIGPGLLRPDALESDFGYLGVPWCRSKHGKTVDWTSKDLLKALEEFVPIYETRPIKNNMYGMGFDHSFGLWFITRWLKPDLVIESGAFKGHSTWVLRQAMPDKRIISLSPRHPGKYLQKGPAYVDANCTYYAGKEFVDFGSVDWASVMKKHGITDLSRVLIFFDDHQNELKRLKQALKAGFRHLVFEDNYDTGTGDHYSLRQICDQFYIRGGGHSCFSDSDEARIRARRKKFWEKAVDVQELCGPGETWWGVRGEMRDNFNHSNTPISYAEHFQNSRFVESILDVYWEIPPVAGPSLTHQTRYDPARAPSPIVEDGRYGLFQRLGLGGGHSCFSDSDEARIRARRKKFWDKAVDVQELCGPGETWWGVRGEMRDNFNHSNTPISYAEHFQNSRFVESILDVYWEIPPVAGPSLTHQTSYDPARAPSPIVEDGRYGLFQRLGLGRLETPVFNGYPRWYI